MEYSSADLDKLQLQVSDNGAGLPDARRAQIKEGVGLANTRARLEHLYGADYLFDLGNRDKDGLVVSLTIPFRVEGKDKALG